jgi:phospholipid-binding lipoprotein MlaA
MKNCQRIIVFSLFMLLSLLPVNMNVAAQGSYPDFLGDDVTGVDYLDDDESREKDISDPLEPMNRVFFEFNDVLYEWVLKPVTDGYIWIFPLELRQSFGNFFSNIAMPIRLLNSLLQGNLEQSGIVVQRFLINSTLGVYGFADIADVEFGVKARRADFGQTLGKWGIGEGIYLFWPVIGPSTVRGSIGRVVDVFSHPLPYFNDNQTFEISYYTTDRVNDLSLNRDAYEDLKRFSVDPYVASRQAYYEYRRSLVNKK